MSTYKIIDLVQRSPEWHAFREGKIGASQAAAVLGVDPWKTKRQLWFDILRKEGVKPPSFAMQRGIELEDAALQWFNRKLGSNFKPIVAQSIEHPDIFASLDGWNGGIHCEIKVPSLEKHILFRETREVPHHYFVQMQHQMYVMGSPMGFYVSFDGKEGIFEEVERDEKFIKNMVLEELDFLASLVHFKVPEATDRDEVEIIDSEAVSLSRRYYDLLDQKEMIEMEIEKTRETLLKYCKNDLNKIGPLKIAKVVRKGNIDYGSMEFLKEIDLESYRKPPIESWRFS